MSPPISLTLGKAWLELFIEIIIEVLALFEKKELHFLEEVPQCFLMLVSLQLQLFDLPIENLHLIF